jgi:flavin-dependent dehydrogenase
LAYFFGRILCIAKQISGIILMQPFDVVVVGAGLAGLQCTRLLAGHGLSVLIVDRKQSLEQGVHTTGIFVRRSLEDFSLPPAFLGPPIRHVTLYSPARRQLQLESPHDEFRIGHMGPLYSRLLKDCQAAGANWLGASAYLGSEPAPGGSLVRLNVAGTAETVVARYVVAADGAASHVARDLGLDANRRWIVGVEEVFAEAPFSGPPRLHAFLDHRLAPGYIAWVAEDGQAMHVGVGGYAAGFQPAAALHRFRASLGGLVSLENARLVERRGGRIPVGGILPNIANARGLAIGDAAGAVSPLTAGGLDPCLRLSELAAKVIWKYLTSGDPAHLAAYDGRLFRRRFLVRRAFRTAYSWAGFNPILEAGCGLLRLPGCKGIGQRVFFGRGSFPDLLAPEPSQSLAKARAVSSGEPQKPQAVAVN